MQTYNPRSSLTTLTFWKNGVLMAAVDAAICFFIPFYATRTNGRLTMNDVFSVGKTVFTALLGSVTLEVWRLGAVTTHAMALPLTCSVFPLTSSGLHAISAEY